MKTDGILPNLVNGVSRQPFAVRLPSQVQDCTNGYPTISKGLTKRPPSRFIAKYTKPAGTPLIHTIERDDIERYTVSAMTDDIIVHDLTTGTEKAVVAAGGFDYLSCDNPATDIELMTVIDTTWVLNKTVTAGVLTTETASRDYECLIYVNAGLYDAGYEIRINNSVVADYTTADGSDSSDGNQKLEHRATEPVQIMTGLCTGTNDGTATFTKNLNTHLGAAFDFQQYGNVVHIWNNSATDFTVKAQSKDDTKFYAIKDKHPDFSKLPSKGPDGFNIEISGDEKSNWDNYWLTFEEGTNAPEGIWVESCPPGTLTTLDPDTLPHKLIRIADGTFTFGPSTYDIRTVGDLELSPWPGFVDSEIDGMTFWKNRFGVYSGEYVTLSEAGQYGNFFRTTVLQVLDSDPIDVQLAYPDLSKIQALVPFNENLIAFTDNVQFRMEGDELITPATAHFKPVTEFYSNADVKPVSSGSSLFFHCSPDYGDGAKIREFLFDVDFGFREGSEITDHCEGYIPSDMAVLTSSKISKCLAAICPSDPQAVFLYKYYWQTRDTKIQSAWTRWEFDADVLHVTISRDDIYVLLHVGAEVWIESIPLAEGFYDYGMRTVYHLDHRLITSQLTSAYDAGADETTFTAPFTLDATAIIIRNTGTDMAGVVAGADIVVPGDETAATVFVGKPFDFEAELTRMVPKKSFSKDGSPAPFNADLTITNISFSLFDTGYLKFTTEDKFRDTATHEFTGLYGDTIDTVGGVTLYNGMAVCSVDSNSRDVTMKVSSDSYLPFSIGSVYWTGDIGKPE